MALSSVELVFLPVALLVLRSSVSVLVAVLSSVVAVLLSSVVAVLRSSVSVLVAGAPEGR